MFWITFFIQKYLFVIGDFRSIILKNMKNWFIFQNLLCGSNNILALSNIAVFFDEHLSE